MDPNVCISTIVVWLKLSSADTLQHATRSETTSQEHKNMSAVTQVAATMWLFELLFSQCHLWNEMRTKVLFKSIMRKLHLASPSKNSIFRLS